MNNNDPCHDLAVEDYYCYEIKTNEEHIKKRSEQNTKERENEPTKETTKERNEERTKERQKERDNIIKKAGTR